MGNPISFTGVTSGGLTVREVDGNPTVPQVKTIVVSNGTLTDNGGGVVTITTGGGGGGGVTTINFGTTGLTPNSATSGVVTVAGTLVLANGGTGATTAAAARTNLEIVSGRFTQAVGAGGAISAIVVTDSNVTATNTIVFTLEPSLGLIAPAGAGTIGARNSGTSFTVAVQVDNPTAGSLDCFVNYVIIG